MTREQILDLFRRIATPLEQRITRRTPSPQQRNRTASEEQHVKKLKLSADCKTNFETRAKVLLKRDYTDAISDGVSSPKRIRQKICWP